MAFDPNTLPANTTGVYLVRTNLDTGEQWKTDDVGQSLQMNTDTLWSGNWRYELVFYIGPNTLPGPSNQSNTWSSTYNGRAKLAVLHMKR